MTPWIACFLAASLLAADAAARERYCLGGVCRSSCVMKVCLYVSANESYGVIDAENDFNVPVGVRVEFDRLVNVVPYPRPPVAAVVPPGKSKQIVKLSVISPGAAGEFPFTWSFTYGDPTARHSARAMYRMPFGGTEGRVLTQGQNGRFSHSGTAAYSFDFGMPIGTPILAARLGRVVEVNDGYTESGVAPEFLDKANAVTVLHADGTFATYAHLDPGAGVRPGMLVNYGDLLGFSGDTGFSTGPHLHFSVWKAGYDDGTGTIPIRFHDGSGAGFVPQASVAQRPGCHADGVRCKPGEFPEAFPAKRSSHVERSQDGTCRCKNGAIITTHLPCRMVCP